MLSTHPLQSFGCPQIQSFSPRNRTWQCNPKLSHLPEDPKSSIEMGFSLTNHSFGGTPIYGNPHMKRPHCMVCPGLTCIDPVAEAPSGWPERPGDGLTELKELLWMSTLLVVAVYRIEPFAFLFKMMEHIFGKRVDPCP